MPQTSKKVVYFPSLHSPRNIKIRVKLPIWIKVMVFKGIVLTIRLLMYFVSLNFRFNVR